MKTICIAGKNDIAVDVMNYCLNVYSDFRIVCILCRNEKGVNSWQKSLKWFAESKNVEIITLEEAYDIEDLVFLSVEFDRIIKTDRFVSGRLFNIHFSLLPKYKGCGSVVLPILNGDEYTGVTLHVIRDGIDTGEIIAQKTIEINNDNSLELYKRLMRLATELLIDNLQSIIEGNYKFQKQSGERSTYFAINEIDYSKVELNINKTAFQVMKQIQAFAFRPFQLIKWNTNSYIDAKISDEVSISKPGTIIHDDDAVTVVSTIDYDVIMYKDTLSQVFDAIKTNDVNQVKLLCQSKKIIDSQNDSGWTPLTYAIIKNNLELVRFFIRQDSNIHILDYEGRNLLFYAKNTFKETNDASIFELLIDMKLNPNQKDYNNRSIYDYCIEEGIEKIGNVVVDCSE